MNQSSSEQEITGFSDDWRWRRTKDSLGAMGLLAWHRVESRENRCKGREMVVRWRSQLGASAAGLQWHFLLPSSTAVMAPWSYTLLGRNPNRSGHAPPREAWTQSRGDGNRAGLFMIANTIWTAFVRYISLARPFGDAELLRRERGAPLCFLRFLWCLNCTCPKPKEMCTDVNMRVKTGRSCPAGHWGAVGMMSSVVPFPRAWEHILQLCNSYSPNQNALLLMFGN